jgi:EAL domain-containing protein (putative c-di-GMP-specific phosphodiesterase class I)
LGIELEATTLRAALDGAATLPASSWLNLNVSPELILSDRLAPILRGNDIRLVLEVTEHIAVGDYDHVRAQLWRLGAHVRLAVDDAGAGFASLRHILELRPNFIKLDRTLIAGIDADPARQALVVGLRHFAVTTGCILVAEGVETEAEAATLRAIPIDLGQGFLFGRPAPAPDAPAAALIPIGIGHRRSVAGLAQSAATIL